MLIPNVNTGYKWGNAILFNFLAFMAVASHSRAMLADPVSFIHVLYTMSLYILLSFQNYLP
jgi:hypothetical protein